MSIDNSGLAAVAAASDAVSTTDHSADVASAAAAAKADGEKAGALAAQSRIRAILTSEQAKGRKKLANHLAFNTSMAAEEAIEMLALAEQKVEGPKPGSRLDALMADQQPKVDTTEANAAASQTARLNAAVTRQLGKLGKKPLVLN